LVFCPAQFFPILEKNFREVISMRNNNKIQSAIAGLLDMFRTEEIPEKIAIATNPKFDVPSSKWSLNNRLIQMVHGTFDSRGIRQWREAERKVKKGAKA